MNLSQFISSISIRGRLAFGVTCLERVCSEWNVKNERMDQLIEELWSFVNSISDWEERIMNLLPDEDDAELNAKYFHYDHLTISQQKDLTNLIDEIVHIGMRNSCSAFVNEVTLEPTLIVAKILTDNDIQLPNLSIFTKSPVTENEGWGNVVDPKFFREN